MSESLKQLGPYAIEGTLGGNGVFLSLQAVEMSRGIPALIVAVPQSQITTPEVWQVFTHEVGELLSGAGAKVCQPVAHGDDQGYYWAAFDWLSGAHLGMVVRDNGLPSYEQSFMWMAEVADALAGLHRRGVSHRCLSPASIFLTDQLEVKLLHASWSLMLLYTVDGLASPAMTCVLPFVAPEILGGASGDEAADVYSLGANLYFLLCGMPVFWDDDPIQLAQMAMSSPPNLGNLPAELPDDARELMEDLLVKTPEERPRNLPALRDRLRQIAATMREIDSQGGSNSPAPAVAPIAQPMGGPSPMIHNSLSNGDQAALPNHGAINHQDPHQQPYEQPAGSGYASEEPAPGEGRGLPPIDEEDPVEKKKTLIKLGISVGVLVLVVGSLAFSLLGKGDGAGNKKPDAETEVVEAEVGPAPVATPAAPRATPTPRRPPPELVAKYSDTSRRLLNIARVMSIYQKQRGIGESDWPKSFSDISRFATPDEFQDAWNNDMEFRVSYVISAGADGKWDTADDVWYDAAKMEPGGYSPTLDTPQ